MYTPNRHSLLRILLPALLGVITILQAPGAQAPEASAVLNPKADSATLDTPKKQKFASLRRHFSWGLDAGSSIDLSGEDMSTIDVETYFGYKGSLIRNAGVGVGMHKAFGNQYTFVPLYAMLRTSFRKKPSPLFFELKLGYSFNTLAHSGSIGGAYGSLGVGFNLKMSRSFQSHIILSYSYFTLRKATEVDVPYSGDNINSAVLRFGINF